MVHSTHKINLRTYEYKLSNILGTVPMYKASYIVLRLDFFGLKLLHIRRLVSDFCMTCNLTAERLRSELWQRLSGYVVQKSYRNHIRGEALSFDF
jgi:hypothetical protein